MADRIVKGVGAMIGLATEAHAAHKEHKAARAHEATNGDQRTARKELEAGNAQEASSGDSGRHSPTNQSRPNASEHPSISSHDTASSYKTQGATRDAPTLPEEDSPSAYPGFEGESHEKDEADWEIDDAIAEHEDETEREPPPGFEEYFDAVPERELGPVPSSKEGKQYYVDKIVSTFLTKHPLPQDFHSTPLPSAVIIPQRRPHSKRRGFVRAYAPVLENAGIDQTTFLQFLKSMQQSARASPYFRIVNIAAMVIGCVPSVACMVVSAVMNVAVMAAMEVQENQRNNDFLTQMNEKFFRPRGLYCLIFAYKPDDGAHTSTVDVTQTIFDKLKPSSGGKIGQVLKNSTRASGKTHGEIEMPEAAPLIFPLLDEIEDTKSQSKMKRRGKFVANYFDKRAQAAYTTENPDSTLVHLNAQKHTFASRYADPNHPVNSGNPISLLTGGIINPGPPGGMRGGYGGRGGGLGGGLGGGRLRGGASGFGGLGDLVVGVAGLMHNKDNKGQQQIGNHQQDEYQDGYQDDQQLQYNQAQQYGRGQGGVMMGGGFGGRAGMMGGRGGMGGYNQMGGGYNQGGPLGFGGPGAIKRMLTPNVLYLMVVNMPSEEEMAAAKVMLQQNS